MSIKRSKTSIKIDRSTENRGASDVTDFVQVKNSSRKDEMTAVDFVYEDSSGKKSRLRMADQLQPQIAVKIEFVKVALSVQVVNFQVAWQFQKIEYGSQLHIAKPGAYFYSMEIGLKPDGSSETDWLVEKPTTFG